ncbi:transporter substrate-binding domain-containing protein [Kitasatospora sp. NPDC059463]|uniref:transporter substrate-binding domain-containing protein n=1 Tax=unclassified Kitasatospora TaxID=2633591 RepID=UPI003678E090
MTGTARGAAAARAAAMAALLAVAAGGCGADPTPSLFANAKQVRVGAKNDQPGTGFEAHAGEFSGLDITVTTELLNEIGARSPIFGGVLSKNRAIDLHSKKFDLVAATFSITDNRMLPLGTSTEAGGLDFVGPYASTLQGMLVRAADKDRYRTLDDLVGKRVCVWGGTTSAEQLKETGKQFDTTVLDDAGYCVKALKENRTDAVSTDLLILYGFMQADASLTVVPELAFGRGNDYGIALAKGHRKDCERLRDALKKYVAGNNWTRDLRDNLKLVPQAMADEARPTATEIDALSCRDHPDPAYAK